MSGDKEPEFTRGQQLVIKLLVLLIHTCLLALVGTSTVLSVMHGLQGHIVGWLCFVPCVALLWVAARVITYRGEPADDSHP